MDRAIPTINKILKRREDDRNRAIHLEHLKAVRSMTTTNQEVPNFTMSYNKKKQLILENRYTQIERENRILLQKISSIMNNKKKYESLNPSQSVNKSLNVNYKKKKNLLIEFQNAKLLKRLRSKRSEYPAYKMHKQYQKQQYFARNIASFPLIDEFNIKHDFPRLIQKSRQNYEKPSILNKQTKIMRQIMVGGRYLYITIKANSSGLLIMARDLQEAIVSGPKIIEIKRQEAEKFIKEYCGNKIERIFYFLGYDGYTLYLLSNQTNDSIIKQENTNDYAVNASQIE